MIKESVGGMGVGLAPEIFPAATDSRFLRRKNVIQPTKDFFHFFFLNRTHSVIASFRALFASDTDPSVLFFAHQQDPNPFARPQRYDPKKRFTWKVFEFIAP